MTYSEFMDKRGMVNHVDSGIQEDLAFEPSEPSDPAAQEVDPVIEPTALETTEQVAPVPSDPAAQEVDPVIEG
jgi:hypothetical protein